MARTHNTRSQPDLHKKNENVLASASHDGGPASIYHPSGAIGILKPSLCFNTAAGRSSHHDLREANCRHGNPTVGFPFKGLVPLPCLPMHIVREPIALLAPNRMTARDPAPPAARGRCAAV